MSEFNRRIRWLFSQPVKDPEDLKLLKAAGIPEDFADNGSFAALRLFERAVKSGELSAIKEIKLAIEEDLDNKGTGSFLLPAITLCEKFMPVYRDIHEEGHSEYLLYGGRGSTKSSFVSLVIIELLINNPEFHGVICRKVKDTLRDSVYAQICWAITTLGLDESFDCRTSPLEIEYRPTGQKLYFRGADKPAKIKSIKPKFGYIGLLWFEELDQFAGTEEIRSIEQSVLRGGDRCFVFKTFNPPRTVSSWVNRYATVDNPHCMMHKSTYLDVPPAWLGKKFIDDAQMLKITNYRAYEHEYLGVPTGNGGNVFENVELREITDEEIARMDKICYGIDWGWYPDPLRVHAVYLSGRRLYIIDEISGNRITNDSLCTYLSEHGIEKTDKIVADSGGEGPKTIADFRARGYYMRPARKGKGSVEHSMKWLSSLDKIIIDPKRCPNAAREFSEYEFEQAEDGSFISGYPDRDNHSIDAVRYATEEHRRKKG